MCSSAARASAAFAELDFLYNYHTRRQTEAWLIQGSTSQDWTAVLRLKESPRRVQGWVSLSYDTKTGNFTSGYLDCIVILIKNWQLQTQMNYDFHVQGVQLRPLPDPPRRPHHGPGFLPLAFAAVPRWKCCRR